MLQHAGDSYFWNGDAYTMKCANCPLLNDAENCPALASAVPRYCDLVNPSHPAFDALYAGFLRRLVSRHEAVQVAPVAPLPVPRVSGGCCG
jgi:hypothetical protein